MDYVYEIMPMVHGFFVAFFVVLKLLATAFGYRKKRKGKLL